MTTIMQWASEDQAFSERYARAMEARHERMAEEILAISDKGSNDWMESNDPENAGYRLNGEHVQRSRLRVDTRKWLLSKLAAKKYGDKLDMNVNGNLGNDMTVAETAQSSRDQLRTEDKS